MNILSINIDNDFNNNESNPLNYYNKHCILAYLEKHMNIDKFREFTKNQLLHIIDIQNINIDLIELKEISKNIMDEYEKKSGKNTNFMLSILQFNEFNVRCIKVSKNDNSTYSIVFDTIVRCELNGNNVIVDDEVLEIKPNEFCWKNSSGDLIAKNIPLYKKNYS